MLARTTLTGIRVAVVTILIFGSFLGLSSILTKGGEGNGGTVDGSEELVLSWSKSVPGDVMDIAVSGNYLFLACNESGLQILSLTTREIVGNYNTSGLTFGVSVQGNYAYLADWDNGLIVLDISDPTAPDFMGRLNTTGLAYKVAIQYQYAYVCDWDKGMAIVDISNKTNLMEVGRFSEVDHATDCVVYGNLVYLVDWQRLRILNVADRANPQEIANLSTPGWAYGLAVERWYAYIADDWRGLRIVNVSDPLNPKEIGHIIPDNLTVHVQLSGGYAYLANLEGEILVIDVSDPENPVEVAAFDTPGRSRRIVLYDGEVYVADGEEGVVVLEEYQPPVEHPNEPDYWIYFLVIPIVAVLIPIFNWKSRKMSGEGPIPKRATVEKGIGVETVDFQGPHHALKLSSDSYLGQCLLSKEIGLELNPRNIALIKKQIEYDLSTITTPEQRFRLYLAMKQLSYHLFPANEWLRDLFHNHREHLKFHTYFDVPESASRVLGHWGLPQGLKGKVHLDGERKAIVERIVNSPTGENFVIIGEPGVGKTALLFEVFDLLMSRDNCAMVTSTNMGRFHEHQGIRLFMDDIPEEQVLISDIQHKRSSGLVVSAREKDWETLPYDFQRMFIRLTIRNFSRDDLWELCVNLLAVSSVMADDDALDLLVEYADGSPIFVWTLLDQLRKSGQRTLTVTFIRENASRGMLSYIGDILIRLLRETREGRGIGSAEGMRGVEEERSTGRAGNVEGMRGKDEGRGIGRVEGMRGRGGGGIYRRGGFHGLAMLYFLAAHTEGRKCSTIYFNRVAEIISERMRVIFGVDKIMNPENPGLVLSCLNIRNDMIGFPHDFWADLVLGKGDRNPFAGDLIFIREKLSDSGIFEEGKREALAGSWKLALERHQTNPVRSRDEFLAFCEQILTNFTMEELRDHGVDIEMIRQVAAQYAHLPEGESILMRIERVAPLPTQKIIQITDSVILKSKIN